MKKILKSVGKGIGKGAGAVAYYSAATIGAAISAIWETTGTRGVYREALEECDDEKLIQINMNSQSDNGDYEMYLLSKTVLESRNYYFNEKTKEWQKR